MLFKGFIKFVSSVGSFLDISGRSGVAFLFGLYSRLALDN
jgi:hypothetical protein